jgi:two-component system, chemotaxis family, chemotaxis protein CheY
MSFQNLDSKVILVVDDDPIIQEIIIEYLVSFGFKNFLKAKNGTEAFRYVSDQSQRIDLIISDWDMPETDGITFLKAVRSHKNRFSTPFIMVTAQQTDERTKITSAKQANVNSYIIKPFRGEILREKVFQVIFQNSSQSNAA